MNAGGSILAQYIIFLVSFLTLAVVDIIFWVKLDLLHDFAFLQTIVFIEQTTLLIPINYVIGIHYSVLSK